ncbi:MAG: methyltransferase [Candidatus Methylacidiphilales bacterium]
MKLIAKKFIAIFIAPIVLYYLKNDRIYSYQGVKILVKKGVFHPAFFYSTKLLINYLNQFDLKDKKLLELGAGSGLISFTSAKKNAIVTASDISPTAIEGLTENNNQLGQPITVIESDLFDSFAKQQFDYIIINPPYYPKKAINTEQLAWNCGERFEYFEKLFLQLKAFIHTQSMVLMSLSEDCDIHKIKSIAQKNGYHFETCESKITVSERHFIFKIIHSGN